MNKFSEEHRRKMSEAHKGKPSGMLGKTHSAETKAKMAKAHVGKKHSEETIAKMAAKRSEYWKKFKES